MTEIKIKDWELYYNSPTKKQVYSAIWWANKQGKLDFAEKRGGAWVINQDAFEEYYKDHGYMGIERVKEPEETADPYKEQVIALLTGLFEGVKQTKARQEALANQHQAYKAVVGAHDRWLGELAAKQQEIEKKLESLDPLWVQFVVGIVGGLISPIIVGLFAWLIWG